MGSLYIVAGHRHGRRGDDGLVNRAYTHTLCFLCSLLFHPLSLSLAPPPLPLISFSPLSSSHNFSKSAWGEGGSQPNNIELGVVLATTRENMRVQWRERMPCELPSENDKDISATDRLYVHILLYDWNIHPKKVVRRWRFAWLYKRSVIKQHATRVYVMYYDTNNKVTPPAVPPPLSPSFSLSLSLLRYYPAGPDRFRDRYMQALGGQGGDPRAIVEEMKADFIGRPTKKT